METEYTEKKISINIIGSQNCGKTSLIKRIIYNEFNEKKKPQNLRKSDIFYYPLNNILYSIILADISEEEIEEENMDNLVTINNVILFIYELQNYKESFKFVKNKFFFLNNKYDLKTKKIYLIGTKSDLIQAQIPDDFYTKVSIFCQKGGIIDLGKVNSKLMQKEEFKEIFEKIILDLPQENENKNDEEKCHRCKCSMF